MENNKINNPDLHDDPFGIFEEIGDFDFLPESKSKENNTVFSNDDKESANLFGNNEEKDSDISDDIDLLALFESNPALKESDTPDNIHNDKEKSKATNSKIFEDFINNIVEDEDILAGSENENQTSNDGELEDAFDFSSADEESDVFDFSATQSASPVNNAVLPEDVPFDIPTPNISNEPKSSDTLNTKLTSVLQKSDVPSLPFEEPTPAKPTGTRKLYSFTDHEEIVKEIKEKRSYVEFEQQFESERMRMSWEMFLVMQVIGRVAYLTKGQMLRYLQAWKRDYEPEIKADMGVIQTLIRKKWITRTSKPIDFSRGKLNGHKIFPYVMTRSGRMAFGKYDVETANLARVGEPEGKGFDRLEHELLISEVYVHLIEEGNFIYWFMSEENMRREIVQNVWKLWRKRENMTLTDNRLGDFKICYFDKATGRVEMREGEIAVRYKRAQIVRKSDDLWWFCYSEAEADKIELIKNKPAVILTDKLYQEVIKQQTVNQNERKDKKKNDDLTAKWVKSLGGLTVQTGALLTGVKYLAMWRRLKNSADYKMFMTAFEPGAGAGRPICFYVEPEILDTAKKRREAFILNLGLEVLLKKGFAVTVENEIVSVFNEKEKEQYQLIADATVFNTDEEWAKMIPEITKKVALGKRNKMKTMFIVADRFNIHQYASTYRNEVILDLHEYY